MNTVGYDDFIKLEQAFNGVSGLNLLHAAFGDGNAVRRWVFCIAVTAMFGGFIAYLLSWWFGADGLYWWLLLEVIGSALAGWFYAVLVRHHWLKRLGITDLNGSRWWERLQAQRFAQLLHAQLRGRDVRPALLELADAEGQAGLSVLGAQPLVLALVALLVALVNGWAAQADVWDFQKGGFGYTVAVVIGSTLMVLGIAPELITSAQRRREQLRALIRRLP